MNESDKFVLISVAIVTAIALSMAIVAAIKICKCQTCCGKHHRLIPPQEPVPVFPQNNDDENRRLTADLPATFNV